MTVEQLTEVWAPLTLTVAIVSGFVFGFVVLGMFAVDPQYANRDTTPLEGALWTAVTLAGIGLVFYGGQVFTSYAAGDTQWTRVVSRFGVWVMYSTAIGVGLWLRLHIHNAGRKAEAHARAVTELAERE